MLNQVTVKQKPTAWLYAYLISCAFVIIFFPSVSFAQDKIYKTDSTIIAAKVMEISDADIKYKKFSNQNGPAYIIPKKEVWMIVYENGEKEVYNQATKQTTTLPVVVNSNAASVDNPSHEKARNFILTENINEAIASYSQLIAIDSTNATLLAEDAYALALGGIYDAALMRLDRSWSIGANSPDVNYFTAQVFALMGYDDLASEFWKASEKHKTPAWISLKAPILLQKFKRKLPNSAKTNREELIANFKHANELASQSLYFQSIAMFHEIINQYPNEYIPYIGYSITLEKTGAFQKSAQIIEKAISLIGNNSEDIEEKRILEQHLITIKRKMTSLPMYAMPGLHQWNVKDAKSPQMMAYGGFMLSPSLISLNGRIGYYISGGSNASLDFGAGNNSGASFFNLGLSVYNRLHYFVSGGGLLMTSGNGNTDFSLKLSVGFSKMNKNLTSSFDVFLDVNKGLAEGSPTTFGVSVGTSIYFGKRK
ncbi:MAG: hypothetical protein ABII90_05505 [Bacteroidota bacterium]